MKNLHTSSCKRWRNGLKTVRMITVSTISILVLFGFASCSSSISQKEYDGLKNELNNAKQQINTLQEQLNEAMVKEQQYDQLYSQNQKLNKQYEAQSGEMETLKTEYDDLNNSYVQLKQQDDARINEIQTMQNDYDRLNQNFADLKNQYDSLQGKTVFSEEEIDQIIFDLINQDRRNNGLDDLEWGKNLYGWAIWNSRDMAQKGDYKYSDWGGTWQALLITSGQETLEGLTNGAMEVWKQQKYEYSRNFLNPKSPYAAVGTYKSGEVYYITYIASTNP